MKKTTLRALDIVRSQSHYNLNEKNGGLSMSTSNRISKKKKQFKLNSSFRKSTSRLFLSGLSRTEMTPAKRKGAKQGYIYLTGERASPKFPAECNRINYPQNDIGRFITKPSIVENLQFLKSCFDSNIEKVTMKMFDSALDTLKSFHSNNPLFSGIMPKIVDMIKNLCISDGMSTEEESELKILENIQNPVLKEHLMFNKSGRKMFNMHLLDLLFKEIGFKTHKLEFMEKQTKEILKKSNSLEEENKELLGRLEKVKSSKKKMITRNVIMKRTRRKSLLGFGSDRKKNSPIMDPRYVKLINEINSLQNKINDLVNKNTSCKKNEMRILEELILKNDRIKKLEINLESSEEKIAKLSVILTEFRSGSKLMRDTKEHFSRLIEELAEKHLEVLDQVCVDVKEDKEFLATKKVYLAPDHVRLLQEFGIDKKKFKVDSDVGFDGFLTKLLEDFKYLLKRKRRSKARLGGGTAKKFKRAFGKVIMQRRNYKKIQKLKTLKEEEIDSQGSLAKIDNNEIKEVSLIKKSSSNLNTRKSLAARRSSRKYSDLKINRMGNMSVNSPPDNSIRPDLEIMSMSPTRRRLSSLSNRSSIEPISPTKTTIPTSPEIRRNPKYKFGRLKSMNFTTLKIKSTKAISTITRSKTLLQNQNPSDEDTITSINLPDDNRVDLVDLTYVLTFIGTFMDEKLLEIENKLRKFEMVDKILSRL